MIENLLIYTLLIGFKHPQLPVDRVYKYMHDIPEYEFPKIKYPVSQKANLVLPSSIYDSRGELLHPGIYQVYYNAMDKVLLLVQGPKVEGYLRPISIVKNEVEKKISSAKFEIIGRNKAEIV